MIDNLSHPKEVAQVILNVVNSSSPKVRYPVGKDAESVLKARMELSGKERIDITRLFLLVVSTCVCCGGKCTILVQYWVAASIHKTRIHSS